MLSHGKFGSLPQGKPAATQSRYPTLINYKAHTGSFRVSVIHRTLTWTIGSLTSVLDHPYVCVYTRGLGAHRQRVSRTFFFDSEKLSQFFLVLQTQTGVRTSGVWISSPTLYQLSHPPSVVGIVSRVLKGHHCSEHHRNSLPSSAFPHGQPRMVSPVLVIFVCFIA